MTEKELDIVAAKVAGIVWDKFEKQQQETAERMSIYFFDTPFKTIEDRKKEMAGMTCREALDQIKEPL